MAESREWTDPKTGTRVCVGDVWHHNDSRTDRTVAVARVTPGYIFYRRAGAPQTRNPSATMSHAFVKRFTLVSRAPEPTPADPDALKPCPFCGSTDLAVHAMFDDDGKHEVVECVGCGTMGPGSDPESAGSDREAEARRLWNTRVEIEP